MRWTGMLHASERKKVCKVLVGKPERKRPLGSSKHRWEDGIKMILGRLARREWGGFIWLSIETYGRLL
jgi:hypothetical protein